MWTTENRSRYDHGRLRYPSDAVRNETSRTVDSARQAQGLMREFINSLTYMLSVGRQWATLPKDLPPKGTVYDYSEPWSWDDTLVRNHHEFDAACRDVSPTAAILGSRSGRIAKKRTHDARDYAAGKRVKSRKCHNLVDTHGLLMHAIMHTAALRDRDDDCAGDSDIARHVSLSTAYLCEW